MKRPDRWLRSSPDDFGWREICARHSLSPVAAKLIAQKGLEGGALGDFINADTMPLPDPGRLPSIGPALERLREAIGRRERVLVHGDYDVDGLMGTAILVAGLRLLGADVTFYVPSRFSGGYGLSEASLEAAERAGAGLVVTADCGTNAGAILDGFKSSGIDIIVTDHHMTRGAPADGEIMVNPCSVEDHPDRDLCGASIAMQVMRGLFESLGRRPPVDPFLRLAAIATVADIVPLTPANRTISRVGLKSLSSSPNPALAGLLKIAGIVPPVRSCHIGYGLAPRFNAAGRMEDAGLVINLLLEKDPAKAMAYANRLDMLNRKRKVYQGEAWEAVESQIEPGHCGRVCFAVLEGRRFIGVAGPIAARLAEKYGRSAFVVTLDGEEGVGSGRWVEGDNVSGLISMCSGMLARFGGHEGAVGFTVRRENIQRLKSMLMEAPPTSIPEKVSTYIEVLPDEMGQVWEAWGLLDPFGPGNPEPYLGFEVRTPGYFREIKDKHLSWVEVLPSGRGIPFIYWGAKEEGVSQSSVSRGKMLLGRPMPESRPKDFPFYFHVQGII